MSTGQRTSVDVVQGIYEAVERGDLDEIIAALDENVEWVEPDGGTYGGTYHGPDEVMENLFTELGGEWEEFELVCLDRRTHESSPALIRPGEVREINPEGGQESTGLVTRFSIKRVPTPHGYPVALRLLSETDVIRIISNTFMLDCNQSEEEPPKPDRIRSLLDDLRALARPSPMDRLNEDDVYELQEYYEKHFKGNRVVEALTGTYWAAAAQLAPRLAIAERARLFALLWGEVEEFTAVYKELYGALSRLGFADEAFCPIAALVPRSESIIDVRTLNGLGGRSGTLEIMGKGGSPVSLPRAQITALIAELRITIRDKPWDFFDHTDLLDFPGARSRENIDDVRKHLKVKESALQGLFLRGKVAYLFDRYCAEQELTSMLLCIGPSNQEVRTLPAMIKDWIDTHQGPDPAARARQQTALFLVLTKFDAEFEEKAGQAESSEARWTVRLNSSLLDFFGKSHDWPHEWEPGRPFNNTFWLRNPNFKSKHILDYDPATGAEAGLRASEKQRIAGFRAEYLKNESVRAHFADPARSWDEAFRLNDGGISYLAESLAPVCNPDIKRRQIEARVALQREAMLSRLSRYYISGNLDEELRKRRTAAQQVVRRLAHCVQSQRFGLLLRSMQLTDAELADLYYQVETQPHGSDGIGGGPRPALGPTVAADDLLADVFGEALPEPALEDGDAEGGTPEPAAPRDIGDLFADAVLERWIEGLRLLADTPRMYDYFRMTDDTISGLVSELIAGARRLELRDAIAVRARSITSFRQKVDVAMAKPALVAANIINRYIDWMGFDALPLDARPMAGQGDQRRAIFAPRAQANGQITLPAEPVAYDRMQYVDWMAGFVKLVEDNAMSQGGQMVDVAQNTRIGELVEALHGAR